MLEIFPLLSQFIITDSRRHVCAISGIGAFLFSLCVYGFFFWFFFLFTSSLAVICQKLNLVRETYKYD